MAVGRGGASLSQTDGAPRVGARPLEAVPPRVAKFSAAAGWIPAEARTLDGFGSAPTAPSLAALWGMGQVLPDESVVTDSGTDELLSSESLLSDFVSEAMEG